MSNQIIIRSRILKIPNQPLFLLLRMLKYRYLKPPVNVAKYQLLTILCWLQGRLFYGRDCLYKKTAVFIE